MEPTNRIELLERLDLIEKLLRSGRSKEYYSVDEFAKLVGRAPFTVRQWCNLGRVKARRTMTQTGPSRRWAISHEEYLRFQRDGLLPLRLVSRP